MEQIELIHLQALDKTLPPGSIRLDMNPNLQLWVAEMLPRDLAYLNGAGIDARWLVAEADPAFFALTKRLHHALHGMAGDGSPLDAVGRRHYEAVSEANAAKLLAVVGDCAVAGHADLVVLHDPQVLGLARPLRCAHP